MARGLLLSLLLLGGCWRSPPPFLTLDASGMRVHEQTMRWSELTHLSEVKLPAPEGPFRMLVAAGPEGRSLTLCATFTAAPPPGSTAASLAGNVAVSSQVFDDVRREVCRAAGLELLDTTPTGPVYGRVIASRISPPPSPLNF